MGSRRKCCICGTNNNDILNLGEMKTLCDLNAHYYCLLLASSIKQSGEDHEGVLGFLYSDIVEEIKTSRQKMCTYCFRGGASVACSAKSCKTTFHLPCGIEHNSGHQFYGMFLSHCVVHRPRQKFAKQKDPQVCPICYDAINFEQWMEYLWAPCCKKNSYFHKECIQQMALSAGYFFKCPICNNTDQFQKTMKHYGVFIPDRDASWELEPNAFQELLYRHEECNAKSCICTLGRNHSGEGVWTIVLCSSCGSQGTHRTCNKLRKYERWVCHDCTPDENAPKTLPTPNTSALPPELAQPSTSSSTTPSNSIQNNSMLLERIDSNPAYQLRKRKRSDSATPEHDITIVLDSDTEDDDIEIVEVENLPPRQKRQVAEPQNNFMNLMITDVRSLADTPENESVTGIKEETNEYQQEYLEPYIYMSSQ